MDDWKRLLERSEEATKKSVVKEKSAEKDETENSIAKVAAIFKHAKRVLFITGAGVSAESGVATYRGQNGLYNDEDVESGLRIEQIVSAKTFKNNPELTWKYLGKVEEASRDAKPNRAHEVMAEMEQSEDFDRVCILTQNVDGLHRAAGSKNVIEIHGNAHDLHCSSCGHSKTVDSYEGMEIPPNCDQCDGLYRPKVVLFDELLDIDKLASLERQCGDGFDVVVSVGTSSLFPYIVAPIIDAQKQGIPTVEINPGDTMLSRTVNYKIKYGAAVSLDRIWELRNTT